MLVALLAVAAPASGAPGASFDYSPAQPLTGESITFTSTSGPGAVSWDLDGDDLCNDGDGSVAARTFATAGRYPVTICLSGAESSRQTRTITVLNRPPTASFTIVPAAPVAREAVTLTSTAVDADGPIVAQEWDLDADGVFDDARGASALYFWTRAGTYPVALRVTDRDGAPALALAWVKVARRPAQLLSPAPLVRVTGRPTRAGARLDLLAVTAPRGARVGVRCRGRNCPYRRKRFTAKGERVVLRALRRTFVAGSVIEIRVTKPETIGRFTRVRIRAGRRPARLDRCLQPGRAKPVRCPSA